MESGDWHGHVTLWDCQFGIRVLMEKLKTQKIYNCWCFRLAKTWSGPLMGWTQQTLLVVGFGHKARVENDACGLYSNR